MRLHLETLGDGASAVVHLHGAWLDHTSLLPLARPWGPALRPVVVDLRGHGQSPALTGPVTVEEFADDVAETLRFHGIGRSLIVGHSLGGMVAMALARRHPRHVLALVLLETSWGVGETWWERLAMRLVGPVLRLPARWLAPWFARAHARHAGAAAQPPEAAARAAALVPVIRRELERAPPRWLWQAVSRFQAWTWLRDVNVPGIVFVGVHHRATHAQAPRIAAALRDGAVETVSDAGHLLPLEAPDAVVEATKAWLGGLKTL
jgi:3-oxoadipate enol-lactonase